MPVDIDEQSRAGRLGAGFLAYWNDFASGQSYVFDRVLYTRADVGQALLNLQMDLAVDVLAIATADAELTRAVELAVAKPEDATTWTEATRDTIRSVMGFPESDPGVTVAASDPVPKCCLITDPCCNIEAIIIVSPLPEPLFGAGPGELIDSAIQGIDCCPTSPPPPPPPPPPDNCGGCCCCPIAGTSSGDAGLASAATVVCCGLDGACDDGEGCTIDDICGGHGPSCGGSECCGLAKDCDDGDPCTTDSCDWGASGNCINVPRCDDDNLCTEDVCTNGDCSYPPKDCDDGNVCTWDACNPGTGACINDPRCGQSTCCPSGEGSFCCPAANMVCCTNPDHCCDAEETCCGAGCCRLDETCCSGQCGLEGACCFFDTGSCSVTTQHCCQNQGGVYQGDGTVCLPGDLCSPICEDCHAVSAVLYECFHIGTAPCGTAACIVNTINTATCDFFPSRIGPPNCNTKTLATEPWVVQEVWRLQDLSCANYQPGDFQVWMERFYGCGTECVQDGPIKTRCDTFGCEGAFDFTQSRFPRRACGCP